MIAGVTLARSVDPLGPIDVDPDDVRDRACGVTAPGRLCDPATPDPPPDPPDLPDPWIGSLLANVLVVALVVMLLVGAVWLVSRWRATGRPLGDDSTEDLDEDVDAVLGARVLDEDTPPERWRRLAAEHFERGEFRQAIRCRYRALVGDLARAGYVDEIAGRTSGEEREQVAETVGRLVTVAAETSSDVTRSFDTAADRFDAAWFDDGDVTATDHAGFVAAESVVLASLESGPGRRSFTGARR